MNWSLLLELESSCFVNDWRVFLVIQLKRWWIWLYVSDSCASEPVFLQDVGVTVGAHVRVVCLVSDTPHTNRDFTVHLFGDSCRFGLCCSHCYETNIPGYSVLPVLAGVRPYATQKAHYGNISMFNVSEFVFRYFVVFYWVFR